MVTITSLRPDSVQVALNSYDILLHLFDHLQSSHKGPNRAALAACARVCRAWQEPASYVLWRNLPALHPLWNLLAGRNFSPEAKWISPFWQVSLCTHTMGEHAPLGNYAVGKGMRCAQIPSSSTLLAPT